MAARSLLALALHTALASRPCVDSDWRFGFTECLSDLRGGLSRGAFAYAPGSTCDPNHANSRPLPQPLLNLPCHEPCEAGTRLDIHLASRPGGGPTLQVGCKPCGVGAFSLGGGLLADGRGGDWAKPWPPGLGTFCFYRGADYLWHPGSAPASVCVLRLRVSAGERVAHTRAGTWNARLPNAEAELEAPIVAAGGDKLVCGDPQVNVKGAAVLVLRGVCPFQRKAENLAKAGAVAIVVYNNDANAGYFIPAAVNESATPSIPIFMVTRETGEAWLAELGPEAQLYAASMNCRELEPTSVLGALSNSSAEALSRETWQSIEGHRLCDPWAADPSGRFIHSGNNLHYHWIFSVLTLGVNFVRDGHIRFRYSVDSERNYDGLSFAVDQADKLTIVSWQAPYEDFEVEVPRGAHTFTWVYSKDYGRSAGMDQARIQLLELVGTDYADLECRDCRAFDADRVDCGLCGHDSYLDTANGSAGCRNCPPGSWAARGSVDIESCYHYRACTPDDVERSYLAFEVVDGARRVVPGEACRENRALVRHSWRQPLMCDPNRTGSASLPAERVGQCAPCQPHESRPRGGACEPANLTCPVGSYAMRELKVGHWHTWPRNFSTELWGPEFAGFGAWQRSADGTAAVVGTAFTGSASTLWSALKPELRVDVALLHLDVELDSAGNLSFTAELKPRGVTAELKPSGVWGSMAKISVNGSAGLGERVEYGSKFFKVMLPLPAGVHRVTWSWHYDAEATDQGVEADASGLRLLNVSVTHALSAGSGRCEHCQGGYEVAPGAASCRPCAPGKSSTMYAADGSDRGRSVTCQRCPAGRAASAGAASCYKCGPGLQSSSGERHCRPMPVLGEAVQWNVEALAQAWSERVNGSLRTVKVEGHYFHLGLFAMGARPDGVGGELAYWWERLPPLTGVRDGVCSTRLAELRLVANRLESLKPTAGEEEGTGFWAEFSGTCGQGDSRVRHSRIFFRCDALAASGNPFAAAAAGLSAAGSSWAPDLSFASGHRPTTLRGCEDLVLEWRTSFACPLCRREDFIPVAESRCQGEKGKQMRFVNKRPCKGGVQRPEGYWEPCTGKVGVIVTVVAVVILLVLCCLGFYVILLRRRYSKYMKLEEQGATAPPSTIGVPTSA